MFAELQITAPCEYLASGFTSSLIAAEEAMFNLNSREERKRILFYIFYTLYMELYVF